MSQDVSMYSAYRNIMPASVLRILEMLIYSEVLSSKCRISPHNNMCTFIKQQNFTPQEHVYIDKISFLMACISYNLHVDFSRKLPEMHNPRNCWKVMHIQYIESTSFFQCNVFL